MSKITYSNKSALYENSDIADVNKVKAEDMNEIKACVNNNDDMLTGGAVAGSMVVESIKTKNLFDKNAINGYRIGSDGALYGDSDYFASDMIPINSSTPYTLIRTNINSSGLCCYALYDSNKTFISRSGFIRATDLTFTSPSNAKYIRITDLYNNLNSLQLEEGSTATAYSEYQALNPKNYVMYTDNGWIVKKYNDGTFDAWYPYSQSKTATTTGTLFGLNVTSNLILAMPSIATSVNIYHYNVNATFTGQYSFPIFWIDTSNNLVYRIVANGAVSTAMAYRLSAYICGKY